MSNSSSTPYESPAEIALRKSLARGQSIDESVFLGLQVAGGHILLPILVITFFVSAKVPRNPVFINFCLSWIVSSIIYSLLVYRGRSDPNDLSLTASPQECLVQASLINGAQALTSCSTLAIIVQLLKTLWTLKASNESMADKMAHYAKTRHILTYVLLVVPFVGFMTFSIVSLVLGSPAAISTTTWQAIPDTNLALPSTFYCIILTNLSSTQSLTHGLKILRAVYIFSSVVTLASLCLEAHAAMLIIMQRRQLRAILPNGWLGLFLRILSFSLYRALALGLNLALVVHSDEILLTGLSTNNLFNGVIDFVQAAIPLVAFLIFASERDVLDVWSFWRKPPKDTRAGVRNSYNRRSEVKRKNSDGDNLNV